MFFFLPALIIISKPIYTKVMNYIIIDVREPEEYEMSHVKGSINIPLQHLNSQTSELGNLARDTNLVVYCRSGNRSGIAQKLLERQGFTNITNGINKERVEAHFGL